MSEPHLLFELTDADGKPVVRLSVNGQPVSQEPFEYDEESQTALKAQRVDKNTLKHP